MEQGGFYAINYGFNHRDVECDYSHVYFQSWVERNDSVILQLGVLYYWEHDGGMTRITDDPIADAERWIREQDKQLERLPHCDYCGEPIQEEYYFDLCGDRVCERCIDEMKRKVEYED